MQGREEGSKEAKYEMKTTNKGTILFKSFWPSCSKLTMSLVNVSLILKYGIYANIFAEKM